jgi:hypothetical protein
LLLRLPRIDDGSLPVTRLSTWLLALAWSKRTEFCAPIEKLFQWMMALGELVTVSALPLMRAVAWPAAVLMPVGRA